MRLDKLISNATDYSRNDAKKLIKQGNVRINGQIHRRADSIIHTDEDKIQLFEQALSLPTFRYFMFHKPMDVVCATQDSEHPTVIDYLNLPQKNQLQIVGRLDRDTTGLVLLTDNGQWNHRVTSPNKGCSKTYLVTAKHPIQSDTVAIFKQGMLLKSETKKTRPAKLTIINDYQATLIIQEGKYHQIKRMFAAIGNRVEKLHRQSIGSIELDTALLPGDYRPLTAKEINAF